MPVYDYTCTKCEVRTEHILLGNQAAPETCEECGGALKRAYSGSRVHVSLQGWGFSKTDALISDAKGPRKDFKALRDRAERIRDE